MPKIAFQIDLPEGVDPASVVKVMVRKGKYIEEYALVHVGKERDLKLNTQNEPAIHTWNPFSVTMDVFNTYGVVVTDRPASLLARISARALKIGEGKFPRVVKAYCEDEFCLKAGLSLKGLENSMDRIASRLTVGTRASKVTKEEYHRPYAGPKDTDEPLTDEELKQADEYAKKIGIKLEDGK